MTCKYCGSTIKDTVEFCPLCGKDINGMDHLPKNQTIASPTNDTQEEIEYYTSFKVLKIVFFILSTAVSFVTYGFIDEWDITFEMGLGILLGCFLFSSLYTAIYFLPYRVAAKKKHRQTRAIYILNIFAGWTILIWFIALIWANAETKETVVVVPQTSGSDEILGYKKLLDDGIITQEEFDAKKKQILGL